jgi:superfamily II DNA/RNA helicase
VLLVWFCFVSFAHGELLAADVKAQCLASLELQNALIADTMLLFLTLQVGGRSVVNSDIAQFVEIRPESERFLRLLEVLGEWYEAGKIIIFVHTQDKCDNLFRDLLKVRA